MINSLSSWQKIHPASYIQALKLGIQREVAELMDWELRKSYEQQYEEMLTWESRPSPKTKEGKALQSLQQYRPDLYEKLLTENPKLLPRPTFEQYYKEMLTWESRPSKKTREYKILIRLQQYRPDLYEKLLKENPRLKPRLTSTSEQNYEEMLTWKSRPKKKTKKYEALNRLQQNKPDLYEKLLKENPILKPKVKETK